MKLTVLIVLAISNATWWTTERKKVCFYAYTSLGTILSSHPPDFLWNYHIIYLQYIMKHKKMGYKANKKRWFCIDIWFRYYPIISSTYFLYMNSSSYYLFMIYLQYIVKQKFAFVHISIFRYACDWYTVLSSCGQTFNYYLYIICQQYMMKL